MPVEGSSAEVTMLAGIPARIGNRTDPDCALQFETFRVNIATREVPGARIRMNSLESLYREIDERRDALVELTQRLVSIPTLNPPGINYQEFCEFLDNRLKSSGFTTELLRAEGAVGDSDLHPRLNLIARREGPRKGDCLHFNSHYDVVTAGKDWTRDPFSGEVEGDRIYGRGSCDMKGGLATSIIAAEAFISVFPDFSGSIEISATADEESGGYAGVAWLAEKGYFSPERVQHVIIPEPLNKDRICIGHRGVWWAEITTMGKIAHGCMPFLGDCAVRHMGTVIDALENVLMPRLDKRVTDKPVVPPMARRSTLNINAIHGGEPQQQDDYTGFSSTCVPDSCNLVLDRRFIPEETLDGVRAEIIDLLDGIKSARPGFDYRLREIFSVPSVMASRTAPIVELVGNGIRDVLSTEAEIVLSPGTYDQKHVSMIGGLENCIAYGPGELDLAHQADEWVSIDDMIDSAKVMAHTMTAIHTDTFKSKG